MDHPNMQDMLDLVSYTLDGDREKEDFFEQIEMGDLEPDGVKLHELLGCPDIGDVIVAALNDLYENGDDKCQEFALQFGTSHAYPTALRIRAALTNTTEIVEEEAPLGSLEPVEEAYKRNVQG